jgi:nitrite reductase/ring-hydroxylating ferredoxin subunit
MAFERVATLADVPSTRGLCVTVAGLSIGLFRVGDSIHAMENACPHQGDPLSEGDLLGPIVTCLSHGWQFDVRTGFRPEDADGWPIPCFEVKIDGGDVWVDVARPTNLRGRRDQRSQK